MRGLTKFSQASVITVFFLLVLSSLAFAGEGLRLFPVPKISVAEDNINKELEVFFSRNKDYASTYFARKFKEAYPESVTDVIDNTNKYRTFVVSVQIPRASKYEIKKPDGTLDIYLPVTMSIYFTNILTGEVLYSYAYTNYAVYTATKKSMNAETINRLYKQNLEDLVAEMIKNTKAKFNPFEINAKAVSLWKGYVILDKGRDSGIAVNDTLTDKNSYQINIIHAGMNYAVGTTIIGEPQEGSVFTKLSNQSSDQIKKPKVVVLRIDNPKVFPEQAVQQFFSDSLGGKAQFTLLPVQRNFYSVQDYVLRATNLEQKLRYERELPDYFIRLSILPPSFMRLKTNKSYVDYNTYSVVVFGELLDSAGRVIYSAHSTETITDEVVSGITFSDEARLQIVIKNGILALAKQFSENIKFTHLELPVEKTDTDSIYVKDRYNTLSLGANAKVFTKLGRISGIKEDVFVPIWEVSIAGTEGTTAQAGKVLPTNNGAPDPARGDVIILEAVQSGSEARAYVMSMCGGCVNLGGGEDFGECETVARYGVSGALKFPFYAGKDFQTDVNRIINEALFKKRLAPFRVAATPYCIEPVYRLVKQEAVCPDAACTTKLSVTAGLRVKKENEVVFKKGLEHKLTVQAGKESQSEMIRKEVAKDTYGLFEELTKSIQMK